ncbi:cobyric acid synthase [Bacillus aerolatus]|uniref:Cobyric acid synthase n=1 Tax=Bacillus aerolatus TaxID=2653354 RepID=A0A6I1FD16_9BACI|nr:cobyric acid synthase [Bacillus aerolatus]KAB7705375.1 cobyric acid synthase [Bacillus aerolatus]
MKGVMIQGTASDAGKSLVATALCRLLVQKGFRPAPFKSQNVTNNSYVTDDGKEIGKAQVLQAEACNIEASPEMNPILLKPSGSGRSEVIWLGEQMEVILGMEYREQYYERAVKTIRQSLETLSRQADFLVIEGAGSPVEMNLKHREVVNMKVAELADVPVILIADINRGGLFASVIGTLELLEPDERKRVKGLIVNKFHGDPALFDEGKQWLEERTGIPVLAVLPYLADHQLEEEDALSLTNRPSSSGREPEKEQTIMKEKEETYNQLAGHLQEYLDWEKFLSIVSGSKKENIQ